MQRDYYYAYPYRKRLYIVTVLLCLFIGFTGAHRFYSGSPVYGKFLLFTLGGCGILWLCDIFLITGILQVFLCSNPLTCLIGKDLKYHSGDGVILV